ncbi:MAG: flavin prenyltransferase UbiX [Mariprofundaceae bacterium]|nr:flavin prenyltransferase UbiX [Mariprofundaceae bacterium]
MRALKKIEDNAEQVFMGADGKQQIIVAMTGASGAGYGLRLMQCLANAGIHQHVLISSAARVVLKQETDIELPAAPDESGRVLATQLDIPPDALTCYGLEDWFSPAASGSAGIRRMVVVPCSMGTMARIASGASDNLIERAADVVLKEHGLLILVPREMPVSSIHLENMLKLSRMGVHMLPAMPGFYHRPKRIEELVDFVVERVLDHLDMASGEARRWGA